MATEVVVTSFPPCEVHFNRLHETVDAHYDAKTTWGPWAYMCEACFKNYGPDRLGTGYGQRLVKKDS